MLYISIVSHGHSNYLTKNNALVEISKLGGVNVVVRDNLGEKALSEFCHREDIGYLGGGRRLGFGENNNAIFSFIESEYQIRDEDFFLILNPDVVLSVESFLRFYSILNEQKYPLSTIDLFLDSEYKKRDPFIRKFPGAFDFVSSFLFHRNMTLIDRSEGVEDFDWCAGSFMCFRVEVFRGLRGFDESYFMYCEDLDICYRAKMIGVSAKYIPDVRAIHVAQLGNRKLFSKHFFWHVSSIFRYLLKTRLKKYIGLTLPVKSTLI